MKRILSTLIVLTAFIFVLTSCQPQYNPDLTPLDQEIQDLKDSIFQLQQQVDLLSKKLENLEKNASSTSSQLESTTLKVKFLEEYQTTSRSTIDYLSNRVKKLEEDLKSLNARFSKFQLDTETSEELMKRDITLLQQKAQNTSTTIEKLKESVSTLDAKYIELNSEISKLKVENPLLSSVKLIFSKLNEFESKLNTLSYEQSSFKEDLEERVAVIDAEYAELSQRLQNIEDETRKKFEILSKIPTSTSSEVDVENIVGYIAGLQQRIDELQKKYDAQLSDINSFKEGIYSYISKQVIPLRGNIEDITAQLKTSSQTIRELKVDLSSLKASIEQIKIDMNTTQVEGPSETVPATVIVTTKLEDAEKLRTEIEKIRSEMENRWLDIMKNVKELELVMRPDESLEELLSLDGGTLKYEIKKGDTLAEISQAFGLGESGVDELIRINNISDPRKLQVGQIIKIPVRDTASLFTWPLATTKRVDFDNIVGYFGQSDGNAMKPGLEIKTKIADTVLSILPGRVILVTQSGGYYTVRIYHGDGLVSGYSYLGSVKVKEGDMVKSGQAIGTVGKTSRGYLLRFEIWKNGEPKDPMRILYKLAGSFEITFYTEWEDGKTVYDPDFRVTKSGEPPRPWYTVAADPSIFPLGTVLYIPDLAPFTNGTPFFVVQDVGGAVKGSKLDVYVDDINFAANNKIFCEVYYWGS